MEGSEVATSVAGLNVWFKVQFVKEVDHYGSCLGNCADKNLVENGGPISITVNISEPSHYSIELTM